MKKIHTRAKRMFRLSTHNKHDGFFHPSGRKKRPKTFKTEESANKWAEKHGLKQYSLKPAKRGKKFQIVQNE